MYVVAILCSRLLTISYWLLPDFPGSCNISYGVVPSWKVREYFVGKKYLSRELQSEKLLVHFLCYTKK